MAQLLFEMTSAGLKPRLPRDPDGTSREPDGRYLTLDEAAKLTGRPRDELRDEYLAMLADELALSGPTAAELGISDAADLDVPMEESGALRALHKNEFGHLPPDGFRYVLEFCRRHNLSPWSRLVWATLKWSQDQKEWTVEIRLRIDGFRLLAGRTKLVGGNEATVFDYGEGERHPLKATVTIYRLAGEDKVAFKGEAHWDECYAGGEFWDRMPHRMLEKCAEVNALRRAFPEVFGGIVMAEESLPVAGGRKGRPPGAGPAPAKPAGLSQPPPPKTALEFHRELAALGFKDENQRNALVAQMRVRFPGLELARPTFFYQRALTEIRLHPEKYGAAPPDSEMG